MKSAAVEVEVGGRQLRLSNLDKVLYPAHGFTKGQVIDYYARVAPVLLPHLAGRPVTRKRWPDGVEGEGFYEKNCPRHRPDWVATLTVQTRREAVEFCMVDSVAALVWLANLAALELHPSLSAAPELDQPSLLVFDLDPGPPAAMAHCARLALILSEFLARYGLSAVPKTSGSKGLQVYVPLNSPATYAQTSAFALAVARHLENAHPDLVVSNMTKAVRTGKVLVDWSQNSASKTTVSVYSLRARATPTVSTPVRWDEVEAAAGGCDLSFGADQVHDRIQSQGDLFAPALSLVQTLPPPPEP
ncbi:MAG: non-homologous end-joining DNA ligase [Acidimicrobiales bacterium]